MKRHVTSLLTAVGRPGRARATGLLVLLSGWQVQAASFAQTITLAERNQPLTEVLRKIEQQSGYALLYNTQMMQAARPVTLSVRGASLTEALDQCFAGQPLTYTIEQNAIVVKPRPAAAPPAPRAAAVARPITGRVTDGQGQGLPGVTVRVLGTTAGTTTGPDGTFQLDVPDGATTLSFSFVGFATQEVALGSRTDFSIRLAEASALLDAVTVTGYTSYSRDNSASAATTVTSAKIEQVPLPGIDQILQGRVPGLNVLSNSGQPGSATTSVTIRGLGTLNGSSAPLYIMDGIPIEANYFQTLNANDIASVTVLKDASAKALYGSRGSNGVIVITTKKGQSGRLAVDYTVQTGFSNLTSPRFVMMNTEERLRFEEEVGLEIGRNIGPGWTYSPRNPAYAKQTPAQQQRSNFILDSLGGINTDWRDQFFQRARFTEHQVSLSGGSENVRFYNSFNYFSQDGIARRTGMDRYTVRSNVDFKGKKLSGSVNLLLGLSNSSFTEGEGGTGVGSSMASVYYALPYEYPYAADGTMVLPNTKGYSYLDQREGTIGLDRLQNSSNKTQQAKTTLGGTLSYTIVPGLVASTRAGLDFRNSLDQVYINPDSYYGTRSNSNTLGGRGRFEEGVRQNYSLVSTTGLNFNRMFSEVHDVEVGAYFESLFDNYRGFGYAGFGLDGRLPETPAAITASTTYLPRLSGARTQSALHSFIGTGRYTYNGRYTLTGSYRVDGSSKVPSKNRWHSFYSVGANWNIKDEAFLRDASLLSTLRLRGSYGLTASPFGGNFLYRATYDVGSSYGGATALRPTNPGNPNFDWEYVAETNVGLDVGLLPGSRIRLVVDAYNRITRNMFVDQPLSATAGFATYSLSTGRLRNRGIEADLQGDVLNKGDVRWTVGTNVAYNKNEILELGNGLNNLPDGDTRLLRIGEPIGSYYAPKWAGVDPANGDALYYNQDGSTTNVYNANAQSTTGVGVLYPTITGGVSTDVSWKGLSLSALFVYVSDVKRWNNEDFYNENQRYMTSNQSVRMLNDRWKKPGDNAILQRIDVPRNFTSKDIQDASFGRLRNVQLAYALPAPLLQKVGVVRGVRLQLQAQNLFTFTSWRGLDPENNSQYGRFQYPSARTYTAGLTVNL
ncbi:SusC/RagA family TonB-linked outer membrane protein [Hymenobacter actinosclerus]|uniref:TonB-linked outer membrane protein, SusC/RagA family n=1 Tax=Hymenobacter actinosclerus TaxID=82805 RepID=A0A1I0FL66_9BACT|nr:SusC/RagA family TonB-linked outer membrane protein [Hymenobacter actinosclerus]SET59048.1 TonB-linked outer membrane protein, SusC/RagA family [Hymenobacter actinosclerus]